MVKRLARYHPRHQTHQAPCEFDRPLFPAGHALLARRPRGPVARLYRKAARYGAVIASQIALALIGMNGRFAPEAAGRKLNNCDVFFSLRSGHRPPD